MIKPRQQRPYIGRGETLVQGVYPPRTADRGSFDCAREGGAALRMTGIRVQRSSGGDSGKDQQALFLGLQLRGLFACSC
jgi:hypothetical protein